MRINRKRIDVLAMLAKNDGVMTALVLYRKLQEEIR
jgi:Fe2+ or Zn2+ uptake regulation protein